MITDKHLEKIKEYVAENQANSPLYTEKHVFPAAEIGRDFFEGYENPDQRNIVIAGLLLHDIGYHKNYESNESDHIVRGMEIAKGLLRKIGVIFNDSRVIDTIRTHDGMLEKNSPLENYVVNDADQVAVFKEISWGYHLSRAAFGMSHERALMGCVQEVWKSYNQVMRLKIMKDKYTGDYKLAKQWLSCQVKNIDPELLAENLPEEDFIDTWKFFVSDILDEKQRDSLYSFKIR